MASPMPRTIGARGLCARGGQPRCRKQGTGTHGDGMGGAAVPAVLTKPDDRDHEVLRGADADVEVDALAGSREVNGGVRGWPDPVKRWVRGPAEMRRQALE